MTMLNKLQLKIQDAKKLPPMTGTLKALKDIQLKIIEHKKSIDISNAANFYEIAEERLRSAFNMKMKIYFIILWLITTILVASLVDINLIKIPYSFAYLFHKSIATSVFISSTIFLILWFYSFLHIASNLLLNRTKYEEVD